MLHIEAARALERSLDHAEALLADPACLEVLTDFKLPSGQTPRDVVDAVGVSPREYLRFIVFSDGRGTKAWRSPLTLAATQPGSRVVFICPPSSTRRGPTPRTPTRP